MTELNSSQSSGRGPCQDWFTIWCMICRLTGTELEPKVTSQIAWPSILIGLLLEGFNLVFEGNIFSVSFHFFACFGLQKLTLAPVSGMTIVRVLFTRASTLNLLLLWVFEFCYVKFALGILKRLTLYILSSTSFMLSFDIYLSLSTFLISAVLLQKLLKCPICLHL